MAEGKTCQVKACSWVVVLCPEICAPHWWKLPRTERAAIVRARTVGLRAGNHPSLTYQGLIAKAVANLDALQGILAKYEHEDGDYDLRAARQTWCGECQGIRPHHGIVRGLVPYLVCSECQSMIPTITPGAIAFLGMKADL